MKKNILYKIANFNGCGIDEIGTKKILSLNLPDLRGIDKIKFSEFTENCKHVYFDCETADINTFLRQKIKPSAQEINSFLSAEYNFNFILDASGYQKNFMSWRFFNPTICAHFIKQIILEHPDQVIKFGNGNGILSGKRFPAINTMINQAKRHAVR